MPAGVTAPVLVLRSLSATCHHAASPLPAFAIIVEVYLCIPLTAPPCSPQVSRKTTLVRSLRDMFGEAAWGVVPRCGHRDGTEWGGLGRLGGGMGRGAQVRGGLEWNAVRRVLIGVWGPDAALHLQGAVW